MMVVTAQSGVMTALDAAYTNGTSLAAGRMLQRRENDDEKAVALNLPQVSNKRHTDSGPKKDRGTRNTCSSADLDCVILT